MLRRRAKMQGERVHLLSLRQRVHGLVGAGKGEELGGEIQDGRIFRRLRKESFERGI